MQIELFGSSKKGKKKPMGLRAIKPTGANLLARQIIAHVSAQKGCVCYRISYGVHVNDKGQKRATGQTPGLPDLLAIVNGKMVGIEIKIGTDKLSPTQLERQREFLASGALFWEVKEYKTFKSMFDDLYRCH